MYQGEERRAAYDEVLGRHAAQIEQLRSDVHEIKTDLKALVAVFSEAKGSWRVLAAIAGAAATIGGIVATAWQYIRHP